MPDSLIDGNGLGFLAEVKSDKSLKTSTSMIDEVGSTYGVKQINGKPRVSAMPYLYDIAEGNIAGHTTWNKLGFNNAIGTTTEDMWTPGTEYVFPVSGMRLYVTSTHSQDRQSGLGIQAVRIRYLNPDYVQKSEDVIMTGSGIVATTGSDFFRINFFRATSCGASGAALGNVTVGSGTTYYSYIGSTFSRSRNIIYTVPSGNTLYITSIAYAAESSKSTNPASIRFTNKVNYDDVGSRINFFMSYSEVILENTAYTKTLEIPTKIPATTDIKVSVISSVAAASATCALRGWLE